MPTYEYLCKACDHEFEREQRMSDPKVRTCPKCKKRRVERLISQTSFVLKGSGWYSDLYSSAKGDKDKKDGKDEKDKKPDSSADAGPSEKQDTKKKDDSKKGPKSESASPSKSGSKGPKAAA